MCEINPPQPNSISSGWHPMKRIGPFPKILNPISNNDLKKLISDRSKIYSKAHFKINCETLTKNMIVNQIIERYEKN